MFRKSTAFVFFIVFASSVAAEETILKSTPVGAPVNPTLEVLWHDEMAAIRNQNIEPKFHAWTYDATFAAPNGDKIFVSVFQGAVPTCDNGANDKDAVEVPSLCPAKIARIVNGQITAVVAIPYVCNPGFNAQWDTKNVNQTIVDFDPQKSEITFRAVFHGRPWKKPLGDLPTCVIHRSI